MVQFGSARLQLGSGYVCCGRMLFCVVRLIRLGSAMPGRLRCSFGLVRSGLLRLGSAARVDPVYVGVVARSARLGRDRVTKKDSVQFGSVLVLVCFVCGKVKPI